MSSRLKRLVCVVLLAAMVPTQGCFFGSTTDVSVLPGDTTFVSISFLTTWVSCQQNPLQVSSQTYECAFFQPDTLSTATLSGIELFFFALLVDPLIIQVPPTVTNVHGTFLHASGNGNLAVQGPLASVPIDLTRTLSAEPGTSFYVVSVPTAFQMANPTGSYAFNLQFTVPNGTPSVAAKAVIAGHVRTLAGQDYYPPLFPCVTDMASAPGVTINTAAASSTLTLPAAASIPTCQNVTYAFASTAALAATAAVPTLGGWALALLSLLIAAAALACGRARMRRMWPD